jgi:hypothetical protein
VPVSDLTEDDVNTPLEMLAAIEQLPGRVTVSPSRCKWTLNLPINC